MSKIIRTVGVCVFAAVFVSAGRANAQDANSNSDDSNTKAVFVMTNDVERNVVLAFKRTSAGSLSESGKFRTGGRGSGGTTDPLGSQGSLILSRDGSILFAVNAGSGDVSAFAVHGSELSLLDRAASGGSEPNAIAQYQSLVYVLNAAGSGNVVGFRFDHGHFREIPNSTRFLTGSGAGGSSIAFSPNGKFLVVTEKTTNNLDVFAVGSDGTLSPVVLTKSAGPGVFAVTFALNGAALVSETGPAGVPNSSAISSYALQADGTLSVISPSVPTLGAANCWNATAPDGRFIYTSNTASSSISGFSIGKDGSLTPIGGTVVASNPTGSTNLDIAVSSDGKFLYTLNSGTGTIGIFGIHQDGTLEAVGSVEGIEAKAGVNGIAAN